MPELTLSLSNEVFENLAMKAQELGISSQDYAQRVVEEDVTLGKATKLDIQEGLEELVAYLNKIPTLRVLSNSPTTATDWWVKFVIDINSKLSWRVVQELGFVLNYIALDGRLPTVFMPVSPPPYLNGGPEDYLAWVIESRLSSVDPGDIAAVLEKYLPNPVENEARWLLGGSDRADNP